MKYKKPGAGSVRQTYRIYFYIYNMKNLAPGMGIKAC